MGAHHRKAERELDRLGYARTEDVPGFPVWKLDGHGPVAIDMTSNKAQLDTFMASIRRAHRPLPKPDTDVVPPAEQAAFDRRERERRQREQADYLRIKDKQLGGMAKGKPSWVVDQWAEHAQHLFNDRRELVRELSRRPNQYVTD
jgi:hypothetical protein